MYFYCVGYNSYEEAPRINLVHETKFSQEEFDELVLLAVKAIAPGAVQKGYKDLEESIGWHSEKVLDDMDKWSLLQERAQLEMDAIDIQFQYMYEDVVEYMVNNLGFTRLEYAAGYTPFGWEELRGSTRPHNWSNSKRPPNDDIVKLSQVVKEVTGEYDEEAWEMKKKEIWEEYGQPAVEQERQKRMLKSED